MAITYKTVIANAISHFNDIQTELYKLNAKRLDGSAITAPSDVLVPTSELDDIIKGQLQLKATGTYTLTKADGTEDVSAYQYVKPRAAATFSLAITNKASTDITVGDVSSGYYPLTASLEGKLTAGTSGWFTEGSATDSSVVVGRIKQGTFSNLSGAENTEGNYIVTSTISAGYYKSGMTLTKTFTMPNATFTNGSSNAATFQVSEGTDGNLLSVGNVTLNKPTSGYYYSINMSSSGAATVKSNAAGYVKATTNVGKGTVTGSDIAYVTMSAASGSVEVNSPSIAAGTISTVDVSSTVDTDGSDGVSAAFGDIFKSLSAATTDLPPTGYYLAVKSNSVTRSNVITADATISNAGYIPSTYDFTAAKGSVTINAGSNYYIPITAAVLKNEATTSVKYLESSSVTLKDGYLYIDAGYIPNTKVSLSSLIPDISNDATASHILSGYSAYDETGTLVNGSITTWSAPTSYFTTDSSKGISGSAVTAKNYTGASTQYIIKGSATAPASASGTSANVTVSNGTVTLTKSVSITPSVNAGWVASGTAGSTSVTLSGTIQTTSLTKSTAGSCTIATNSTSPEVSGGKAVISDSTSSPYNTYVIVNASSTGVASVGTGYIGTASQDFAASGSARIAAAIYPSVTSGTPSASLSLTTASTFDATTGEVTSAHATNKTATIGAVTVLNQSTSYKDKYIVGTFTAKTNSGTATTTIGADVTGTGVDHYTEQLYKRMLGLSYEDVEADAA